MDAPPADFHDLRRVPASVEAFWVAEARRALGSPSDEAALDALTPVVGRLSDAFTTERGTTFADYGADAAQRAAYALCFGAQSWVRTRLALADAAATRGWRPASGRAPRVLDVGAGSGAAGLSACTWLTAACGASAVELVAVDRSRGALEALGALARVALPPPLRPSVTTLPTDAKRLADLRAAAAGPFELIVVSFALNELFPDAADAAAEPWLLELARRLAPGGLLLLVEPAPKPYAERLLRLGAAAAARGGLQPWSPQLTAGPWCPPPDPRTWPHEVRAWTVPASLERLNRRLRRSLRELTYAYALLGRDAPAPLAPTRATWRQASPVRRLRGRLGWLGYAADGRLAEYEVQERDLAPQERALLLEAERGDLLEARALRALPHGVERLLGPEPLVRRVTPEGAVALSAG